MIRATVDNKPLLPRFSLSDAKYGSWVELSDYVEGGIIDNKIWRKVSVPLTDLYSEEFELSSVFLINFARMMGNSCYDISGTVDNPTAYNASCDTPQDFYVDNFVLIPADVTVDVLGYKFSSDRTMQHELTKF
jgi:hypothetical protein